MAEERSQPGRVLAGRYRLDERLGEGGMGAIWKAEHLVLAAPVAVKIIDRDVAEDEQAVARFMREAQAAATLRSPHVVQILDYGVDEGTPFIAMELLDGENLAQRLRRVGRLGAEETARIVTHIARAIGRAHDAGIVHRDLKPENVFLIHNVDEEVAKVLDFGVAKVETTALGGSQGARTRTGSLLGTPYYMSPEQAQGNKDVDYRSDLWSLGVIAFECLTGTRPFYSDGLGDLVLQICVRDIPVPSEIAPVPLGFDRWFAKAVEREPEQRFQSARELTDALREALGVETRSGIATYPEIVVSSPSSRHEHDTEPMHELPAPSAPAAASPLPGAGATSVDQSAPTLIASPREVAALSEDPVALAAAAATAPAAVEPIRRSTGTAAVVAVGGGFLLVGLVAGIMFWSRLRSDASDPNSRPLPNVTSPDDPLSRVPARPGGVRRSARAKPSASDKSAARVGSSSSAVLGGSASPLPAAIPPTPPEPAVQHDAPPTGTASVAPPAASQSAEHQPDAGAVHPH